MMSATPRDREVFRMPKTAESADSNTPLPISWKGFAGDVVDPPLESDGRRSEFVEQDATISINAAHFTRKLDGQNAAWRILPDLGISGPSVVYGSPGQLANAEQTAPPISRAPWLEYEFDTASRAAATLELALLPTFPVDAKHELRYAIALDGQSPLTVDAGDSRDWQDNAPPNWPVNVLRNFAVTDIPLGSLRPGHHTLRLIYQDPGIIFEHVIITFAGAPPAYPVPPETSRSKGSNYR
jgi:hypothetical protein